MPAISKFLVLLALVLSASHAQAYTSLSLVAGNQVPINHLAWLQQQMSDPTSEPSREPVREPTKWMDLNAVLPNNLSQINNAVLSNHSNQQESLADQPIWYWWRDQLPNCCFWQFPTNTNQFCFQWIKLLFQDWSSEQTQFSVLWHNTHGSWWAPNKPSNHTLVLGKPTKFLICPCTLLYYLLIWWVVMCWIQSLAVKVQASSTPKVSHHTVALLAFEPVTSKKQNNFATIAVKAIAKM